MAEITLKLTPGQIRVLVGVLDEASEHYSNHGNNEVIVRDPQVARELREGMLAFKVIDQEMASVGGIYFHDHDLMDYLKAQLEVHLKRPPQAG